MKTKDLTICAMFVALITVGAFLKIVIPVEPLDMHFTLQWLFVLLAGLLLGKKRAGLSVLVYLVMGLAGIPIFAAGGGLSYLIRPTFGFLLGFLLAAIAMGALCDKWQKNTWPHLLAASVVGLLCYYGMGMVYFYCISNYLISMPVTWGVVLVNCCLLTIFQDFLLCLLAVVLARRLRPVVGNILA